jgi:hypothetical protein
MERNGSREADTASPPRDLHESKLSAIERSEGSGRQ